MIEELKKAPTEVLSLAETTVDVKSQFFFLPLHLRLTVSALYVWAVKLA